MQRFWDKVAKSGPDECWLWLGCTTATGYGRVYYNGVVQWAHRVAWELTCGPVPTEKEWHGKATYHICHSCDTRNCCNPKHLFMGTNSDNMKDRDRKNRNIKGEEQPTSKLKIADVIAIRQKKLAGGITNQELADSYDIRNQTVSKILNRKLWAHVQ